MGTRARVWKPDLHARGRVGVLVTQASLFKLGGRVKMG